jgi:hypothetical protein
MVGTYIGVNPIVGTESLFMVGGGAVRFSGTDYSNRTSDSFFGIQASCGPVAEIGVAAPFVRARTVAVSAVTVMAISFSGLVSPVPVVLGSGLAGKYGVMLQWACTAINTNVRAHGSIRGT